MILGGLVFTSHIDWFVEPFQGPLLGIYPPCFFPLLHAWQGAIWLVEVPGNESKSVAMLQKSGGDMLANFIGFCFGGKGLSLGGMAINDTPLHPPLLNLETGHMKSRFIPAFFWPC